MLSIKYRENDTYNFSVVWERVTKNTTIKNQIELARVVGVSQSAVSLRKSKDVWPEEWAYRIGRKYRLSTEWILTGEEPKRLSKGKDDSYNQKMLQEVDEWLSELVIDEPERKDWFRLCFEDNFPMFKEWKKRRPDRLTKKKSKHNGVQSGSFYIG